MLNSKEHFTAAMKIQGLDLDLHDQEFVRLGWVIRGQEVYNLELRIAVLESELKSRKS